MRKQILMAATAMLLTGSAFAQNFTEVLQKTFTAFDTTQDQQKKLEASNKLNLIAKKFDKEWLSSYYAAYAKVGLTYNETDVAKKDAWLDEAETFINESVAVLGKDNDETHVLKAMIANARIGVDPKNRWQKYGKVFDENLDKAKELNPDNPRIYLMRGISKFFTPKMFGGGKKAAMPYFEKTDALFVANPAMDISKPYWGRQTNAWFMGQAKGEDKE
ncbi:MAG: hypothetical protein WC716_11340 [Chitinophagaceae bacterium]|jgi:hypothetical protein